MRLIYAPNIGTVYATIPNDGEKIIPFFINDRRIMESEFADPPVQAADIQHLA